MEIQIFTIYILYNKNLILSTSWKLFSKDGLPTNCFAPCAAGVEPDQLEDSNLAAQLWTTIARSFLARAVRLELTWVLTDGFGDRCNRRYAKPV